MKKHGASFLEKKHMHSVESFRWFEDPQKNEQWTRTCRRGGHTPFVQALEERNSSHFFVHSLLDHLGVLEIPVGQNLVWKLCTLEWKLAWMQNCKSNYVKHNFLQRKNNIKQVLYKCTVKLQVCIYQCNLFMLCNCSYAHTSMHIKFKWSKWNH